MIREGKWLNWQTDVQQNSGEVANRKVGNTGTDKNEASQMLGVGRETNRILNSRAGGSWESVEKARNPQGTLQE